MLTQLKLSDSVDFTHRCYITVQSPVHTQLCICVVFFVCDRRWKWFSIESIVNCNCIYHDLSIMFHFNEFRSLKYEKIATATQNMDKKEQHSTEREKKKKNCVCCAVCESICLVNSWNAFSITVFVYTDWSESGTYCAPFHFIYSPFTHKYTLTHTKRDFDTSTLPFLHIHTLPVAALIVQKHQTKQFNWHYNNNTRTSAKIDDIYCVQFFCCLFFESEKCADQYRNWNHSSLFGLKCYFDA